jgi:hypothetical protein
MANFPIRDLGSVGAITDLSPYNIPINGFSTALNVRFDEGKIRRSPIFRTVKGSLGFTPRFAYGIVPSTGFDSVIMISDTYVIKEYNAGTISDRSGSISGNSDPRPFTGTTLSSVTYINREDRVPVFRLSTTTDFADLTNWPTTYRCQSLRSYNDFLIALNTTEGTSTFPNRVRWSNLALSNAVPDSWDEADLTKSAGFNDLGEMQTGIVDGMPLGSNFIIYSSDQVYLMEFVGGTFIFNFRKLFTDAGLINQNCAVEIDGKHYCFGDFDIYMHDGTTKQSICDERVRAFIYGGLNNTSKDKFFVQHNPTLNEIYFCYTSGDSLVNFTNSDRCNRAAIYNYRNNTWSFMDLPNVSSGTVANVNSVNTYATATSLTYGLTGGTYYGQEDSFDRHTLMVGEDKVADGITSDKLLALDLADEGKVSFQLDTESIKPSQVERIGIDLDETKVPLSGYKVIKAIYPQATTTNSSNTNLTLTFGASDTPYSNPVYGSATTYDMATDYKIDSRAAGRYLSYKILVSDSKDFEISGFDIEIEATGSR